MINLKFKQETSGFIDSNYRYALYTYWITFRLLPKCPHATLSTAYSDCDVQDKFLSFMGHITVYIRVFNIGKFTYQFEINGHASNFTKKNFVKDVPEVC